MKIKKINNQFTLHRLIQSLCLSISLLFQSSVFAQSVDNQTKPNRPRLEIEEDNQAGEKDEHSVAINIRQDQQNPPEVAKVKQEENCSQPETIKNNQEPPIILNNKTMETIAKALTETNKFDKGVSFNVKKFDREIYKTLGGGLLGLVLGYFIFATGAGTSLHEVVGHLKMGGQMIYKYQNGTQPLRYHENFQVNGVDSFNKIGSDGIKGFFTWLLGIDSIANGQQGWAKPSLFSQAKTKVAQQMGAEKSQAWISLTGTLSEFLWVNFLLTSGVLLASNGHSFLPSLEVASAVTTIGTTLSYAIPATLMSHDELISKALSGNDFASVAVNLGKTSRLSPHSVASLVAGTMALSYLLVPILSYFYSKSGREEAIPDELAIMEFYKLALQDKKYQEKFFTLLEKFPQKKKFQSFFRSLIHVQKLTHLDDPIVRKRLKNHIRFIRGVTYQLNDYFLENLGKEGLKDIKRRVLQQREELQKIPNWERWLDKVSLASMTVQSTVPLLHSLGQAGLSVVGDMSKVFAATMPIIPTAVAIKTARQAIQDTRSDRAKVPLSAKILSWVQFAADSTAAALMTNMAADVFQNAEVDETFDPLGSWKLPVVFCAKGVASTCAYYRNRILKKTLGQIEENDKNENNQEN